MAKRGPLRGSWLACSLVALGLNFLLLPETGLQSPPPAFAATARGKKPAPKKAAKVSKTAVAEEEAPLAPPPPKRPLSPYILWLNDERPTIMKDLGTRSMAEVSREGGTRWKSLSQKDKKPYVAGALKAKSEYAEELEDFIAQYGEDAAKRKKKAKKPKKDPNAPKRPPTAYILWVQDNHKKLKATLPSDHKPTEVIKLAAESWAKATAKMKAKYQKESEEKRKEYAKEKEKYLESLAAA